MKLLALCLIALFLLIGTFAIYVRVAPADPAVWHIDPRDPALTPRRGAFLLREDGDMKSEVYPIDAKALLARFEAVALAAPRTRRLAGSVEAGHLTLEARSNLWRFPDYISVAAEEVAPGTSRLVVFSRLRFGGDDLGVNRQRLESWLARLAG